MTINILNLFTRETAEKILSRGLAVAKALGLPVTSWRNGDPTKSLYHFAADFFDAQEERNTEFAKSGFMSTAEGDWATLHAKDMYGVDRGAATYATPTVTLHNQGGGVWDLAAGDLRMRCTSTNKTYASTNYPGVLGPGVQLTYELIADEAGAAASVGADELDDFESPAGMATGDVVIVGSTSAAAQDEQSVPELRDQCGDTLGALSPNGPPDAYEYVCKNAELTGNTEINRATTIGDDDSGVVTVYVASAAGTVTAPSVAAAKAAVLKWATPICQKPFVESAIANPVSVTAQITGQDIPASFLAAITGELGKLFLGLPIGGTVYRSRLIAAIHAAVPQAASVNLILPLADTAMAADNVPTLGPVSITEVT
jgi:uncharacterized phage protein gp47/JayE